MSASAQPRTGFIKRLVGKTFLGVQGWKVEGSLPDLKKYIIIGAPHTSNWDFVFYIALVWSLGLRTNFLGKHTLFKGPLGWWMRRQGGLPVERSTPHGAVEQVVKLFDQSDELVLVMAPEGTRKFTKHWRTGFYHIAAGAKLPIVLGYADFTKKVVGFGPLFWPTGDLDADIATMQVFYKGVRGKRPEQGSTVAVK
ncbi:MAG: lysophospholipid acyltransferase family protein [Myxococcota bacterium]